MRIIHGTPLGPARRGSVVTTIDGPPLAMRTDGPSGGFRHCFCQFVAPVIRFLQFKAENGPPERWRGENGVTY